MTICQSMGKGMLLGRLLFVVGWDYGTYGTHGTYGYGTMGQWDSTPCPVEPSRTTHYAPRTSLPAPCYLHPAPFLDTLYISGKVTSYCSRTPKTSSNKPLETTISVKKHADDFCFP